MSNYIVIFKSVLGGIRFQLVALILASIILFQVIFFYLFHAIDREGRLHLVEQSDLITSIVTAVDDATSSGREEYTSRMKIFAPYVHISYSSLRPKEIAAHNLEFMKEIQKINQSYGLANKAFAIQEPSKVEPAIFGVELEDGQYAVLSIYNDKKPAKSIFDWFFRNNSRIPFYLTPLGRSVIFFITLSSIIVIWTLNSIISPLRRLTEYADKFPNNIKTTQVVPIYGPLEVRQLARSINRMQQRIREMINARTYALTAISHDLKTLITRLRLRADLISDDEVRSKVEQDLNQMNSMLEKNLDFLKESESPKYEPLNLVATIQTVIDEFDTHSEKILFEYDGRAVIYGVVIEIKRMISNLIDNALKYSDQVQIHVDSSRGDYITIILEDDGPGIDNDQITHLFEPFVRGDDSRTMTNLSGLGLGLSIVKEAVRKHSGSIELSNKKPHGLFVQITLPIYTKQLSE
jgi:signal transduction histidine kinase